MLQMINKLLQILYLSLGLFFDTHAQDTPVLCYPLGSVDCGLGNESILMTYAECCSQSAAANVYYRSNSSSSQCTICGPVFLEEESYPAFVAGTVLVINWKVHPNSIAVRRYRSRHYEVGSSPEQAIPSDFNPPAFSLKFLALNIGVKYVFSVIARGENGGLSELRLTWEAGKSHLPSFSDFNETENSPSTVTAEWVLSCSGVFPIDQMTIRWREGTNENLELLDKNVATFSYNNSSTPANGALMKYKFQNLTLATVYVVRIEGRNRLGTSSTHFVVETSDIDIVSAGVAPNADSTLISCKILLGVLLLTSFSAILYRSI